MQKTPQMLKKEVLSTNQQTVEVRPSDGHSGLWSRGHATKKNAKKKTLKSYNGIGVGGTIIVPVIQKGILP